MFEIDFKKVCSKCKQRKDILKFYINKDHTNSNICKVCYKIEQEEKRQKKIEEIEYKRTIEYKRIKYKEENKRRRSDPLKKLRMDISNLISNSIKKRNYSKQSKTYEILGIDYNGFYKWLNNEASNKLTYNTDNIHLDHVIPISLAQTEDEILTLNHYSNFQLLLAEENLSKNNRYIYKHNLNRVLKYHPKPELLKDIINRSNINIINIYEEIIYNIINHPSYKAA